MDCRSDRVEDGAVFRLTRPHKLNSTTYVVWQELNTLLDILEADGARFLVVTGEGEKAFCAGTDLGDTIELSTSELCDRCDYARATLLRLSRSPLLSVAALNGLAYGGGLELAMACTFRIAAPRVRLSLPEIKLGAIPAYGGTQFLPALVGQARALDLLLTGRSVDADEALAMGLVSRVADADADVVSLAVALARSVSQYSAPAIAALRQAVATANPRPDDAGMAREGALAREIFAGEDCREGTLAFLEKRAPRFKGR